jgi:hypothetical protein
MHESRSKSNKSCSIWYTLAREFFTIENRKAKKSKWRYVDLRVHIPNFYINPKHSIKQNTLKQYTQSLQAINQW